MNFTKPTQHVRLRQTGLFTNFAFGSLLCSFTFLGLGLCRHRQFWVDHFRRHGRTRHQKADGGGIVGTRRRGRQAGKSLGPADAEIYLASAATVACAAVAGEIVDPREFMASMAVP